MNKREPRRSDLHLDALYPDMPASFSQRVDDALFQALSSRAYGKRRYYRNRRGVMAACACAAAFVALCGATLFLPSLRAHRQTQTAAKPDVPTTTLVMETELPSYAVSSAAPAPEPEQAPETEENANPIVAAQERTPQTQAPTITPTAAPTVTPTAKPQREKDLFQASDVTDAMVEKCALQLADWYCQALRRRSIPDTSSLMETNVDTELWYYALELQIEQLNRSATAAGQTPQPDGIGVLSETSEWLDDETLLETVLFRYEESGATVETRVFLTLRVTDTGLRIVGFDCEGGSVWYDALKAAAEAEMQNGLEQAEANVQAYSTLSGRLHSNMLLQWSDGALYPLRSAGEPEADKALPEKPASELLASLQTGWSVNGRGWSMDGREDAALPELLADGMVPLLSYADFLRCGVSGLGVTVLPDSYGVYLYGNDGLMAEACRGTLEQVRTAFATLPSGMYIVTFRAVLPQTGDTGAFNTDSDAGAQSAETAATDAQPTPAAADGMNEDVTATEERLFAFAMEY